MQIFFQIYWGFFQNMNWQGCVSVLLNLDKFICNFIKILLRLDRQKQFVTHKL